MQEKDSPIENENDDFTNTSSTDNEYSKWVDNQGDEVKNVFGFNSSAELVLSLIHISEPTRPY